MHSLSHSPSCWICKLLISFIEGLIEDNTVTVLSRQVLLGSIDLPIPWSDLPIWIYWSRRDGLLSLINRKFLRNEIINQAGYWLSQIINLTGPQLFLIFKVCPLQLLWGLNWLTRCSRIWLQIYTQRSEYLRYAKVNIVSFSIFYTESHLSKLSQNRKSLAGGKGLCLSLDLLHLNNSLELPQNRFFKELFGNLKRIQLQATH